MLKTVSSSTNINFVSSVTGTAPISSSGGLNPAISISQASTSTNGYLSSTDWNTFNGKQTALVSGTNIKTVNGTSLLGSGDVGTITYAYGGTGQTSVTTGDLLYGSATNTWSKLGIGSTGQILRVVAGAPAWGTDYVGTVTSVAATVPSFLSINGSPVTSSGTLAIGLSGTALPTTSGGTGLTSFTANGVVYASSSSALATGSALTFNGTNLATTGTSSAVTFTATGGRSIFSAVNEPFAVAARYVSTGGTVYFGATDGTATPGIQLSLATGVAGISISSAGIVTMGAYGAGTATFSAAGVISSVSDETWKIKDGAPVNPGAMIKKLQPGYWYYNEEKRETFGEERQLGFYAQNVNAAIGPEAAPEPEEGKPWGYYDRSVLAVVVMSLQKALDTIESLENRLLALEGKS